MTAMKSLPKADVYELEYMYMPWGKLIQRVTDYAIENAKENGSIIDLMCGTGRVLGKIHESRNDVSLHGIDINPDFVKYAAETYPGIHFWTDDVLSINENKRKYDALICTAGTHHIPYERQNQFLHGIESLMSEDAFCIIADPFIDDYTDEHSRKLASAKLGYEYLRETIEKGANDDVIRAAIDVMHNDVFCHEFKTSINKMSVILRSVFGDVRITKTWPLEPSGYGDYFIVCKK